jgi:alcohol dehydrogenase (cytochrome c)
MKEKRLFWALALLVGMMGFSQKTIPNFVPVTDAQLRNPPAGDWLMYRRTYDGWGYSPLNQINTANVSRLRLVWSRAMESGWNEGTPLIRNGVMFLPNNSDVIQALDARTGDLIWEYRRKVEGRDKFANYLGQIKRGIAIYRDKIYTVTGDNFVVALDARTGKVVWETPRGDVGEVMYASAPIIANGVVVAGSSCQFSGFGCYATGHDAETGEELWRNYFIPRKGEPGDETWNNTPFESRWMTGAWGHLTYDSQNDIVYFGSSGTGPASPTVRGTLPPSGDIVTGGPGSQAGTNTRWAVKPKTGQVVWRRQVLPGDSWDQECTFEMMLINTRLAPAPDSVLAVNPAIRSGETRKVLAGVPCKTGTFWSLDARTGEFIYARNTVVQNMIAKVDTRGNVTLNNETILKEVGKAYEVCPTFLGGKDWPPASYFPPLNAIIVPLNNACSTMKPTTAEPTPRDVYATELTWKLAPGQTNMGRLEAISVETGKTLWKFEQRAPNYAAVLTTAGNLVFTGGQDSRLRAHDARNGRLLWSVRLPSTISGHIVTYAVNGKQYVAVVAGSGLADGILSAAVPDVDFKSGSNAVFVFALD